jgi:hypothetical protein
MPAHGRSNGWDVDGFNRRYRGIVDDNAAGGAETMRFRCEYVISNNVTHLACVYYTIFLDPDM